MKKLCLILFSFIFCLFLFCFLNREVFAQTSLVAAPTSTPVPSLTLTPTPEPSISITPTPSAAVDGFWVPSGEVTFAGKSAARAGNFLDWTLQNYKWSVQDGYNNTLVAFWVTIRNVVFAFFVLSVLITAFLLIITRGQSVTIIQFIRRFILVVVLVTFSFAFIQFLYQITDIVQGFFLKSSDGNIIGSKDLLNIAFDYKDFIGFRLSGSRYDESVFSSLLMVKFTSLTYYTMAGVVLMRKIILWFFLIISPVFPLLLFYNPIRNTAKIWIGEFFRWLLYAPIFAILLSGLVTLWHSSTSTTSGIPLNFKFSDTAASVYPTAINILLGGPGQSVSMQNSLNTPDTFALYLVALLMLWVVIILPFILLQIFISYVTSSSAMTDNLFVKQLINKGGALFGRIEAPPSPTVPPPQAPPSKTGVARILPFADKLTMQSQQFQSSGVTMQNQHKTSAKDFASSLQSRNLADTNSDVLRLTNLSIPTMRDIARYETEILSNRTETTQLYDKTIETLERIAKPESISDPLLRQQYSMVRERLSQADRQHNPVASAVLSASMGVKRVSTSVPHLETGGQTAHVKVVSNPFAHVPTASPQAAKVIASTMALPVINRVQSVSLDDYEAIKKLWKENYEKLEPPKDKNGIKKDRKQWLKDDIEKIKNVIALLMINSPEKVKEGMEKVAQILPFLLIGGFSQTEVIAYLKAKMEAAKEVLSSIEKKEEEESTMLSGNENKKEEPKTMQRAAEINPGEENNNG